MSELPVLLLPVLLGAQVSKSAGAGDHPPPHPCQPPNPFEGATI